MSIKCAKDRKLTDEARNQIIEAIPSSRGIDFLAFHNSNCSLSQFISDKVGIPKNVVAGVIADCTRTEVVIMHEILG